MAAYPQEVLDKAKALHDAGVSVKAISEQLNIKPERLYEWRIKGWKRTYVPTESPMPDDFAQVCQDKNIVILTKHYSASSASVRRWLAQMPPEVMEARYKNLGVVIDCKGRTKKVGRPAPPDFENIFLQIGATATASHYRVGKNQIDQWLLSFPTLRERRRLIFLKNRSNAKSRLQIFGPQTALTLVDSAAHYLRRFRSQVFAPSKVLIFKEFKGGMPVYKPMGPEGVYYVEGKGKIPTEDMIEMARSYGWQS